MTHVVGIAASAGGLEAMLGLFAGVRANGQSCYVVAQHMAKDGHDELVVRLIQRESTLPVVLAQDGIALRADTIYVIPSGHDGVLDAEVLRLQAPSPSHLSTPSANVLFDSLARSARDQAIGIVLSGTGSDGALGCRAIRAAGGVTVVQDPAQAKFNGMPQAALDAQVVDHSLAVQGISALLGRICPGQPPAFSETAPAVPSCALAPADLPTAVELPPTNPELLALQHVVQQIAQATGVDFSGYKEDTLLRRLSKRKALRGATTAQDYQALIQRDPLELQALQQLFLVSVSSFFREPEAFDALGRLLAQRLHTQPTGQPIKVWVAGCATGEEVYTLAIVLREALGEDRPYSIVATDLNHVAIRQAQAGVYRCAALRTVDAQRLARYFKPCGDDFEVSPTLREGVRFVQADVLAGPPDAEFDVVSCRNLLIYFKASLQDRLLRDIERALSPQGLLLTGQAESLGFSGHVLYEALDPMYRVYGRRAAA